MSHVEIRNGGFEGEFPLKMRQIRQGRRARFRGTSTRKFRGHLRKSSCLLNVPTGSETVVCCIEVKRFIRILCGEEDAGHTSQLPEQFFSNHASLDIGSRTHRSASLSCFVRSSMSSAPSIRARASELLLEAIEGICIPRLLHASRRQVLWKVIQNGMI